MADYIGNLSLFAFFCGLQARGLEGEGQVPQHEAKAGPTKVKTGWKSSNKKLQIIFFLLELVTGGTQSSSILASNFRIFIV